MNALRARLERVLGWLEHARLDVLLAQETKLADAAAPHAAFERAGYRLAHHGEGRWNGVAIASRCGIEGRRGRVGVVQSALARRGAGTQKHQSNERTKRRSLGSPRTTPAAYVGSDLFGAWSLRRGSRRRCLSCRSVPGRQAINGRTDSRPLGGLPTPRPSVQRGRDGDHIRPERLTTTPRGPGCRLPACVRSRVRGHVPVGVHVHVHVHVHQAATRCANVRTAFPVA